MFISVIVAVFSTATIEFPHNCADSTGGTAEVTILLPDAFNDAETSPNVFAPSTTTDQSTKYTPGVFIVKELLFLTIPENETIVISNGIITFTEFMN